VLALACRGGGAVKGADCPEPAVARLESYWNVEIGQRYWLDMIREDGEWRPAASIPMPHHHATRLELVNLDEFPQLGGATRARLVVVLVSRDIEQARPGQWFTTHHARVVEGCALPE
jgi:hypothetical protein